MLSHRKLKQSKSIVTTIKNSQVQLVEEDILQQVCEQDQEAKSEDEGHETAVKKKVNLLRTSMVHQVK